ncbi:hypothetical protein QV13_12650 [Mesorhizobium hungaricum]|jgi:hypothetical protein|uniref:Uncharacterized protein n=1 Tax=Mesorhizobium hungaricum TaxID=1566387 RepID=A0A1C2DS45_9HYPH|nr:MULTISPECIES: hypothetical protein [Mesorhizobium]MBN9236034.1 hypothetical protein [Mesorhizobium sp.]OCX17601.1 hypothetical protein QV13_12650 [Mesorhizobium hungaricum]
MVTITARNDSYVSGKRTRLWDVIRDGKIVAQMSKSSEAFAKYRILAGPVYRNDFTNQSAALAFCEAL